MHVDLDVYRSCFGGGERFCELQDFASLNLSENWYYRLSKDGTGVKLKFPVRLTPKVKMRNVYAVEGNRVVMRTVPSERCTMYSCTEAFTYEDL